MEENKETTEVVKNEEVGNVETQVNEKKDEEKVVQTFTQEQVNSMLKKEKQKAEKKYEGIDIAKYKEWVESQKTAEQKQAEKEAEIKETENKLTQVMKENAVLKAGVKNEDDVDYILYKVSKLEGEFEDNLKQFLTDNPKYIKGDEVKETKATGTAVKTINTHEDDGVLAILRANHPEMNL